MLYQFKKPIAALIRVLDVDDDEVLNRISASIFNILTSSVKSTREDEPHILFGEFQACNGTERIYHLIKSNVDKDTADVATVILGYIHKAKEIRNLAMKKDVITRLKELTRDTDPWARESSK